MAAALLKAAVILTLRVSREAGVRALVGHAIDGDALSFYTKYGFQIVPAQTRTLLPAIEAIQLAIQPS